MGEVSSWDFDVKVERGGLFRVFKPSEDRVGILIDVNPPNRDLGDGLRDLAVWAYNLALAEARGD
jgi:hypothetical protein